MTFVKYKDDLPENTVNRIKILLASAGIATKEQFYCCGNLAYSCRITIDNHALSELNAGTNGKGMDVQYSLASGYGELMERLQNKMLIFEALKHSGKLHRNNRQLLPFRLFPDEKEHSYSPAEFIDLVNQYFPNYEIDRLKSDIASSTRCITVPFTDVMSREQVEIPIEIVRANSSTGMCSGNTAAEAILQGVNEIFERHVLQRFYIDRTTPPSFPTGYFKGSEIHNRLEQLRQNGYAYDIKDCSLGKGFPVVGLLPSNTHNGTWTFRLGADLDPSIALERCFTEIFQGRKDSEFYFNPSSLGTEINIADEYEKSLRDGTGLFPEELFYDTCDYQFSPTTFHRTGDSHNDLMQVIDYLKSHKYHLLVRDNSFLGFPAYQLMIPGLSDQCHEVRDIAYEFLQYQRHIDDIFPLYRLKALSEDETAEAYSLIKRNYRNSSFIKLFPYCNSPRANVAKHLLLFLLSVKMENYGEACSNFKSYMKFRSVNRLPHSEYLSCVNDYIYLKSRGNSTAAIKAILNRLHTASTIDEVLADFDNPQDIMRNYSFPSCFDCQKCPVGSHCLYRAAVAFEHDIQAIQLANPIDQKRILEII